MTGACSGESGRENWKRANRETFRTGLQTPSGRKIRNRNSPLRAGLLSSLSPLKNKNLCAFISAPLRLCEKIFVSRRAAETQRDKEQNPECEIPWSEARLIISHKIKKPELTLPWEELHSPALKVGFLIY